MISIRINYDDGDHTITRFNGSLAEAEAYYLGCSFGYWSAYQNTELSHKCVSIELIKG